MRLSALLWGELLKAAVAAKAGKQLAHSGSALYSLCSQIWPPPYG